MEEPTQQDKLEAIIRDYAGHIDMRCYHYGVCFCGLNDALEEADMPRIPCTLVR